ncbi:hypothetical protein ALC57_09210 [Trachymyrmex cornetzi]|uniref:Uncharacterized protein n=1 Tax=Trachymyrmex cornetzi TaxID=471704 RepID=A0A195E059_9HYME|nr:hypothetical protein ALC57_09210 [Trachymyrmex cornetzi]
MSLLRRVRDGINVLMVANVVESTGKCKLETHRFGTSDCRKPKTPCYGVASFHSGSERAESSVITRA